MAFGRRAGSVVVRRKEREASDGERAGTLVSVHLLFAVRAAATVGKLGICGF